MKEENKVIAKNAKLEKKVQEIFNKRIKNLYELGLSTRVPKQSHFMSFYTKKS